MKILKKVPIDNYEKIVTPYLLTPPPPQIKEFQLYVNPKKNLLGNKEYMK